MHTCSTATSSCTRLCIDLLDSSLLFLSAVVDLNGRFFGGRIVMASFYDPDKFNKYDLTS